MTASENLPGAENRRPLSSRGTAWAKYLSARLLAAGVKPNQVSVASVVAAALCGLSLLSSAMVEPGGAKAALFFFAACGIQLRLLCNLLDGMLAVEGGLKSPTGELYNDLPDRISDVIIFVCAGIAADSARIIFTGATLGWLAATTAVMTAYIRVLGAASGTPHFFLGPLAKQHRMALMTFACLLSAYAEWTHRTWELIPVALWIVIVGGIYTAVRRLRRISESLHSGNCG